jgi:hypothetical protein
MGWDMVGLSVEVWMQEVLETSVRLQCRREADGVGTDAPRFSLIFINGMRAQKHRISQFLFEDL